MLDADVTDSVIGEGCVIKVGSFEARLCTGLASAFIFSYLSLASSVLRILIAIDFRMLLSS